MSNMLLDGPKIQEVFGWNLRKRLKDKNMTQTKLAIDLGISRLIVGRWVSGSGIPKPRLMAKVCNALECTPDYLMKDHYAG